MLLKKTHFMRDLKLTLSPLASEYRKRLLYRRLWMNFLHLNRVWVHMFIIIIPSLLFLSLLTLPPPHPYFYFPTLWTSPITTPPQSYCSWNNHFSSPSVNPICFANDSKTPLWNNSIVVLMVVVEKETIELRRRRSSEWLL